MGCWRPPGRPRDQPPLFWPGAGEDVEPEVVLVVVAGVDDAAVVDVPRAASDVPAEPPDDGAAVVDWTVACFLT